MRKPPRYLTDTAPPGRLEFPDMTDLSRFLVGVCAFLFLIALPLVVYLKRRRVTSRQLFLYFFSIYLLWYLPYAPIHESAHYVAGRLAGMHAKSYQLVPRFWKGDFINGYINFEDGTQRQNLLSCQAPYVLDGVIVILGYSLFRRKKDYGAFVGGLLLTQIYLRSVFDVAVNYSAGTLARAGDFYYLLGGYHPMAVHIGAWVVMLAGGAGALREIARARPTTVGVAASAGSTVA